MTQTLSIALEVHHGPKPGRPSEGVGDRSQQSPSRNCRAVLGTWKVTRGEEGSRDLRAVRPAAGRA